MVLTRRGIGCKGAYSLGCCCCCWRCVWRRNWSVHCRIASHSHSLALSHSSRHVRRPVGPSSPAHRSAVRRRGCQTFSTKNRQQCMKSSHIRIAKCSEAAASHLRSSRKCSPARADVFWQVAASESRPLGDNSPDVATLWTVGAGFLRLHAGRAPSASSPLYSCHVRTWASQPPPVAGRSPAAATPRATGQLSQHDTVKCRTLQLRRCELCVRLLL